jgi:IS5 family transposase
MLQLNAPGPDLWDSVLPEDLRKLSDELTRVDELLSDPRLMEPFLREFNQTRGRPTVPVATYLRLMYLKFRHKLGYETLVEEVSDSISWRRFCGIAYQQKVPEYTTLIKLTHKYGERMLETLHALILENLKGRKLVRGRKIRMDTTVVAADIHYPTDPSLLHDGLRRMKRILAKVPGVGLRLGRTVKTAKALVFNIAMTLRKRNLASARKVRRLNFKALGLARRAMAKVREALKQVKDQRARRRLETTLAVTERAAAQSRERLVGGKPTDRIVSISDPEARPIIKGKLDKPVEFGRIASLVQDESGYFTQADVHVGNPQEAPLTPGILATHQEQFPDALKAVAADTGYSSEENHTLMQSLGVTRIGVRWRGHAPPAIAAKEHRPWFKALYRFRAGIEAGIRFLDRKFGLKRSLFRGTPGTMMWVSWCAIAANLYRFGRGP